MYFLRVGIIFAFVLLQLTALPAAGAVSSSIVISQLQTAGSGTGTAGQEFVEIYNNSNSDINVTGWRLTYSSASDISQSTLFQLTAPDPQTALWLKAKSYATFVSPDYKAATTITGDGTFSYIGGMAATGGHIRLFDGSNIEIDKVAWGTTTVTPPEITAPAPQGGKSLQRVGNNPLQDTDNNIADFSIVTPVIHITGLYEIVTVVDVCANIDGAQPSVPTGMIETGGSCFVDVCPNLDGPQAEIPYGSGKDVSGNCVYDACLNIDGIQAVILLGYESPDAFNCFAKSYILEITELLPNPAGDDNGSELIEVYNPNPYPVNIEGYTLFIGGNFEKSYTLPSHELPPSGYIVFDNAGVGFALVNTQSRAKLIAPNGDTVSETPLYTNAQDEQSWAVIDNVWQYTNQPTFGKSNVASTLDEESPTTTSGLAPCPAGKYRNPLTNRCRSIETDASVLGACDEGQYRNPETGRCRKIVTTTVTPCKDGQYRSEETNRCRNITTASMLKPCSDNQYRSEETGRCRNLTATTVPGSTFAVQPVKDSAMAFVGWWALGGVGLIAAGYAGWEWRREVMVGFGKVTSFFSSKK